MFESNCPTTLYSSILKVDLTAQLNCTISWILWQAGSLFSNFSFAPITVSLVPIMELWTTVFTQISLDFCYILPIYLQQQQLYYLMYVKIEFSREHGPFSTQLKIRSWIMASRCSQVKLQLLNIVLSQDHQKVLSNHTFLINPSVSRHNVSWAIVWKCH